MTDLFSQPEPPKPVICPDGLRRANEPGFWNTTNETGATLREYKSKASAQDARILAIMGDLGMASPSQVWAAMDKVPPITSVRRSMNTLTGAGKLVKTDRKMISPWDRPEHFWQIVTNL